MKLKLKEKKQKQLKSKLKKKKIVIDEEHDPIKDKHCVSDLLIRIHGITSFRILN